MDLKVILVDELEFFEPGERAILRDVVERYIAKSDPYLILISTAGQPASAGGLMQTIEQEEPSIYRKYVMDYSVGLDKIYNQAEIKLARQSPSFPREYECKYMGAGGNIFSSASIDRAVILGQQYDPVKDYRSDCRHVIGCDPGHTDQSKFAITVLQAWNGKIQVLYCDEWANADFTEMLHHVVGLMKKYYRVNAVLVDAANVPFIASLKRMIGERPDYEEHIKELQTRWPHMPLLRSIRVLPVSFSTHHKAMLSNVKAFLDDDRGLVQINPQFQKLIDSLRSAQAKEYSLLKDESPFNDTLDSFRLAMNYFVYQPENAVR
jgi:hypothetical protein